MSTPDTTARTETAETVTVPREPTTEMIDAGYDGLNHFGGIKGMWRAMIDAAPALASPQHPVGVREANIRERIARAMNKALGSEADDHPRHHPAQKSWEEPSEVWWTQWLDAADEVIATLAHPPAQDAPGAVAGRIFGEIRAEREKQLARHGWSPEHDDQHIHAQISKAAICYANPWAPYQDDSPPDGWPWSARWWRPEKTYRANLVKAAALLVAEIERIDRREIAK